MHALSGPSGMLRSPFLPPSCPRHTCFPVPRPLVHHLRCSPLPYSKQVYRSKQQHAPSSAVSDSMAAAAPGNVNSVDKAWDAFKSSVDGEWEGITATFDASGQALELPEHYVPSAYREWDVHLYDWQTQCSAQALQGGEGLRISLKRLMPSVGCEADAVAFTEEAQHGVWLPGKLPVLSDGSYVLAPEQVPEDAKEVRVEACLAKPSTGRLAPRLRMRVVCNIKRAKLAAAWSLDSIEVHKEKWVSPYNGGAELAGCGGGEGNFAKKAALERGRLQEACSTVDSPRLLLQRRPDSHDLRHSSASASGAWLTEMLEGALMLPAGVAAKVHIKDSCIHFATAVLSEDSRGHFIGAACVTFAASGPDETVIY